MAWLQGFRGKVVMVTGASSGIGHATAAAFAAAGAHVGLVARRRELLEEQAAAIVQGGGKAVAAPADVTDAAQVAACFDHVTYMLGPIDVVVNNAGLLIPGPVTTLAPRDLDAMLRVNLFGALAVMQEAIRRMRPRGQGSIVNVASLAGRRGLSPFGGYCASKFALVGLTEALRDELHDEPLHVGLVLPGLVDTPMVDGALHDPEFVELWPPSLSMPPSWVVWAIFAAVRFQLREVSVPPGSATLEKLAALAPGVADSIVHWAKTASHWLATASRRS